MDIREKSGKNLGKLIWDTYGKKEGIAARYGWEQPGVVVVEDTSDQHRMSLSSEKNVKAIPPDVWICLVRPQPCKGDTKHFGCWLSCH